ncbi:MAG: hypothetical protein DRG09_00780 [Epsilonproteobacteria bacterium]|nr:MAG: hypothetical protein DRG09_00780 [Campylobacterota bacterium]
MIKIIKKLFTETKEKKYTPDPPGRTFKRILTGRYFGCEDVTADAAKIAQAKQYKIDQIRELELMPMYVKYTYKKTKEADHDKEIISAYVAFQKEVLAKKWNMIHVTEISFTINHDDLDEFEQMSGVMISKDFRDLTPNNDTPSYQGEERRKNKRND